MDEREQVVLVHSSLSALDYGYDTLRCCLDFSSIIDENYKLTYTFLPMGSR